MIPDNYECDGQMSFPEQDIDLKNERGEWAQEGLFIIRDDDKRCFESVWKPDSCYKTGCSEMEKMIIDDIKRKESE